MICYLIITTAADGKIETEIVLNRPDEAEGREIIECVHRRYARHVEDKRIRAAAKREQLTPGLGGLGGLGGEE